MGFPSPAKDYAEERISLDKEIIRHPNATYFMVMEGSAMLSAFIPPGALLVVDRSLKPKNMDIVVAVVNGEFMTRYLKKNDLKAWLVTVSPRYSEVRITPEMEVTVWGVVISIVIDPTILNHVRLGGL